MDIIAAADEGDDLPQLKFFVVVTWATSFFARASVTVLRGRHYSSMNSTPVSLEGSLSTLGTHARRYLSFPRARFGAAAGFCGTPRFGCTGWSYEVGRSGRSEAHAGLITIGESNAGQFKSLPEDREGRLPRFRCFTLK